MKLLIVGDIVGQVGRKLCKTLIRDLVKEYSADFVIANGENAAAGSGLTPKITEELLSCGIDMLTSGNHVWRRREIFETLESESRLLRPLNYPPQLPGRGSGVYEDAAGHKIAVVNVMGRVFMPAIIDCPFRAAREEINRLKKETNIIIVDFHAEATSEKIAFARYLEGEVSVIFGTHTHVQTADETVFKRHTAYITDVGMTGPFDSVIGRDKEHIIERFLTQIPGRAEVAESWPRLCGIAVEIDPQSGSARSICRIQKDLP